MTRGKKINNLPKRNRTNAETLFKKHEPFIVNFLTVIDVFDTFLNLLLQIYLVIVFFKPKDLYSALSIYFFTVAIYLVMQLLYSKLETGDFQLDYLLVEAKKFLLFITIFFISLHNFNMIFRILKQYVLFYNSTNINNIILVLIICNIIISLNFYYKFYRPKKFITGTYIKGWLDKNDYLYYIYFTLIIELVIKAMIYLYMLEETLVPFLIILFFSVYTLLTVLLPCFYIKKYVSMKYYEYTFLVNFIRNLVLYTSIFNSIFYEYIVIYYNLKRESIFFYINEKFY